MSQLRKLIQVGGEVVRQRFANNINKNMKTSLKISGIILQIVFFFVIGFMFFTFLSARFSVFGLRSFSMATGSMEPKIRVGSVVFTRQFSDYKIGNILTFNRGDISVTHRIVGFKNGGFVTKGDANEFVDSQIVAKSSIIGQDILIVPYLGEFVAFLKTPIAFLLFVGTPILAFVILEKGVIRSEWEKEIERKVFQDDDILEIKQS